MDERTKGRAEIKKELQSVLADCREEHGLKGWPKAVISSEDLKADTLAAVIFCGRGETESVEGAVKVRNHKGFIRFVRKYGAGVRMQAVEERGKKRVQIALTFAGV